MPVSFVDYGVAAFSGFADFYGTDARAAFADVQDPALQAQFAAAAANASRAMRQLSDWLKSQRGSANADFALGADRFARMVRETEGVDVPYSFDGSLVGASAVFAGNLGPNGLIFVLGSDPDEHNSDGGLDYRTVHFLDPVTRKWYSQKTTGMTPFALRFACTAGVSSEDGRFDM